MPVTCELSVLSSGNSGLCTSCLVSVFKQLRTIIYEFLLHNSSSSPSSITLKGPIHRSSEPSATLFYAKVRAQPEAWNKVIA